MFLTFTAIDEFGQLRDFSWWFTSLEFALDIMSSLPAKGKQLIKAELIDNGHHIQLPIEGFDGTSFSTPIKQLEDDWQQLLRVPVCQRPTPSESVDVAAVTSYSSSFDESVWALATVKFED